MRIIGGSLKGRRLLTPTGRGTRPATERVRESIFNMLTSRVDLSGSLVLDLFCGTGSLGLEALSRGAREAVFVDVDGSVLAMARRNAERLEVESQCRFLRRDAVRFLTKHHTEYDVIFADPPYDLATVAELPHRTVPKLRSGGLFFLEHDRRLNFRELESWVDSRAYGRTIVSIFSSVPADQDRPDQLEETS